jgi:3'(2'), 5'-bisphosphate nucleotidase
MQNHQELVSLSIDAALKAGKETLKYYQQDFEVLLKEDHSPLTLADLEANKVINEMLKSTDIPILSEENKLISYEERKSWKKFWLVDPLDGTKEFINKRNEYTINIALIEEGIPVLGVVFAPALYTIYYGLEELGSYKAITTENNDAGDVLSKASQLNKTKPPKELRIVASRSHMSDETRDFISKIEEKSKIRELQSYGSSLKLCMVAEGTADIYPRLGPTMEWDTAASHAVAIHAGCKILNLDGHGALQYNKRDLHNPWFIVYNEKLDTLIESIL